MKKENVDLPSGVSIKFVKNTKNNITIVIPPKPDKGELTEKDLENMAGGHLYCSA